MLALSHLDQLSRVPAPQIAVAYTSQTPRSGADRVVDTDAEGRIVRLRPAATAQDLDHQARLTRTVSECAPVYRAAPCHPDAFAAVVEDILGVRVGLVSGGPTFRDRTLRHVLGQSRRRLIA